MQTRFKITLAYQRPNVKTKTTVILCLRFIFILHTALTGSKRMAKSLTVLKVPLTRNNKEVSIQEPGTVGLNILSRGKHAQIFAKVVVV